MTDQAKVEIEFSLKIQVQETTVEVTGKRSALANSDPNYRALRDSSLKEIYRIENVTLKRDVGELNFAPARSLFFHLYSVASRSPSSWGKTRSIWRPQSPSRPTIFK